ncbi:hypothetical protein C8A01DRAFT_19685 [Parachaetomium inaequale]|uniref:Uncharacterized protein n=1 Tax=Parachaetomium inaequale TaxID=2588326 RepID=A0AAN6PBJ8_9PEZI|nr:hypothetical protein C8A01DRAFT_19685 [Parachaetomium inaequale]
MADIDIAVDYTLRSLTLSEKVLAHELLYSEQYYEPSQSVWLRAPSLNLHEAIVKARAGAKAQEPSFAVRNFSLVCDTLTIDSPQAIAPDAARVFHIDIFARRIIAPEAASGTPSLSLESVPGCSISFGTPQLPQDFELQFIPVDDKSTRVKPLVDADKFYVMVQHQQGSRFPQLQLGPPDSFLNTINYLDRIDETGHIRPGSQLNDDLPRLLQMQLLVAQAHAGTNRALGIELLNYVVAATATPYALQLNCQETSLRNALALEADVMAVPSVNIYASKQVLKARLAAAMAFENAFQNFSSQAHSQKNQTAVALDLLAKSDDAAETYKFLVGIRQRDYDSAVKAYETASATFAQNEQDIDRLTREFEAGIDKYKKAQEVKANKAVLKGIFKVFVAVVATVATAGAAAPVAVGAAGAAATTAVKTVSLFKKLKAIFDKLKKVYEKIKPMIKKLKELVKTAMEVVSVLGKVADAAKEVKALQPGAQSPDVYNATAEWRRFNLRLVDMEESLREYDIEGKRPFFTALKTLVINGEAFIQTQANVVVKSDELATAVLQSKMEKRNHDRLSTMCYVSSTDEAVFGLLRRAMFDRLLSIRSLVYGNFSTYLSTYNYHTLLPEAVISLSPVKPIVDYLEDAAKLQGAVVSFGSRVLVQSRWFRLRTLAGHATAEGLAAQLRDKGAVSVSVDPAAAVWEGFRRIRMGAVRCYLDGVKTTSGGGIIRLQLHTAPHFFDPSDRAGEEEPEKEEHVEPPILTRSFLGDSRTLLFEYQPESGAVVCDGKFGQSLDYTKHTPMTTWDIRVVERRACEEGAGVDFSGVKGVVMEFECDVVWVGV